ncbi:YdcF family protein [bacterium]|nr:YdcF family protein [bacterium]
MLEMMQAMALSLAHALPDENLPALFVHGNKDLEKSSLTLAAQLWREGRVKHLVLNGMTEAECRDMKINYNGAEVWHRWLVQEGKVNPDFIVQVRPGRHTYEEADAFHRLCAERNWNAVAYLSFPYHILRCSLTHLAAMKRLGATRALYPVSLKAVVWFEPVSKQLLGENTIVRPRLEMFDEEWRRIQQYQKKGDCASLAEMIEFFKNQGNNKKI